MIAPDYNPQGTCANGYHGILCANCKRGYSISTTKFECNLCPEYSVNIVRIIGILAVAIIAIVFMIRATLKGAADVKNKTSVFLKILMNHVQLIMLTASFNFRWPSSVEKFFQTNQAVGEASN